jgi:chromosome segregation ATPase
MDTVGPIGLLLMGQVTAVTVLFARAVRRARDVAPGRAPGTGRDARPRAAGSRGVTSTPIEGTAELAALDMERRHAIDALALQRAEHAAAADAFAERRRTALLALHELRRSCRTLASEERTLLVRVGELSAEVRHLEHRRAAIDEGLTASTATSLAIAARTEVARQRLATLKRETDGLVVQGRRERSRLADLMRRRALLTAENAELEALLEVLQQLTGHTGSLTRISDAHPTYGDGPTSSAAADAQPRSSGLLAAEPQPAWSARGRVRRHS